MAIHYPYLPKNWQILYVPEDNPFMLAAREKALKESKDKSVQTGSVMVKDGVIIGTGANGSDFHNNNECVRVKLKIPTGQGYELCEGCHPKNHSEPKAIKDAQDHGFDTQGADLYLWGHWWCCEPCWNAMIEAGIKNVYLLEDSEFLFSKSDPRNILPK